MEAEVLCRSTDSPRAARGPADQEGEGPGCEVPRRLSSLLPPWLLHRAQLLRSTFAQVLLQKLGGLGRCARTRGSEGEGQRRPLLPHPSSRPPWSPRPHVCQRTPTPMPPNHPCAKVCAHPRRNVAVSGGRGGVPPLGGPRAPPPQRRRRPPAAAAPSTARLLPAAALPLQLRSSTRRWSQAQAKAQHEPC